LKDPYELTNEVTQKIVDRLKNEQPQIHQDPNHLRKIVAQELFPHVNVKYAGALALGTYYKSTTAAQHDAYFNALEKHLEQSYAQMLGMYDGQSYMVDKLGPPVGQDLMTIRVTIKNSNGGPPFRLDLHWRQNSVTGQWHAYDLSVEGISQLTVNQNAWAALLRSKGIDGLTTELLRSAMQPITLDKN
jgi:phospholipid transport system substrate-binding protein